MDKRDRPNLLTEWHGTGDLARKRALCVPRMVRLGREHRWHDKCVRAERLNFEHLVRLLNDFTQPDRLLELLLPV